MEEKIIKFYEDEYSKERIEKVSQLFFPPETQRYTIKNVKSKIFNKNKEFAELTIATCGCYLNVRLDDLTAEIEEISTVGDVLEVTFMRRMENEYYPAVVMLKNLQKNITLVNVKLLSIAKFIEEDIDKSKISYNNMISEIKHNDYLIIFGQKVKYSFRDDDSGYFNVDDMTTTQTLNKFDGNIRKLFNRNRRTKIVLPQILSLGLNQLNDVFQIYVFQYDGEKNGFSDGNNFYFNLLDIHNSLDIEFECSLCCIETLTENM